MERNDDVAAARLVLLVGLAGAQGIPCGEGLGCAGLRVVRLPASADAAGLARQARFDAVVLRLSAPLAASASRLQAWRGAFATPLVALVDGDDEVDAIIALELGADAVLPQAVSARRLRAQLLALLRCQGLQCATPPAAADPVVAGWRLDRAGQRLLRGARRVPLTALQVSMLDMLMGAAGQVLARERLAGAVARGRRPGERSVDVYVARLRRRLQAARVDELQIDGVRGRGYRLEARPAAEPQWSAAATWRAPTVEEHISELAHAAS